MRPPPPAINWDLHRGEMLLDPKVANLNTGSFGPVPRPVFARVTDLRRRLAEEPMDFLLRAGPPLLQEARVRLAAFLGAAPERLVFTANVSAAVNLVARSLRPAAGGEILLTDHEYGAMHWCWAEAARRLGLTLRTFALPVTAESPEDIVAAFRAAFTPRTRLLFFSHVLSPTGLVLPAAAICAEARRRGVVTVIDGAHAPAMVPVDVAALGCDYYAGNCHKWLLAPTGAGFLCWNGDAGGQLRPLQVSWGWHFDPRRPDAPNEYGVPARVYHLEFEGTRDYCPWVAVAAAIAYQEGIGWAAIRDRNEQLVRHVRRRLRDELGLTLWTPEHPELHGFLTAFRLPPGVHGKTLQRLLWERHRVEVPGVERPYGWLLRVSTHFYNTTGEIDRLADALPALLREAGGGA